MGRATERYHDASVSELLIDSIDVFHVWPFDPRHAIRVFVLGLEGNDGSAVRNLRFRDDRTDVFDVILSSLQIARFVRSQDVRHARQPARETSTRNFCIDCPLCQHKLQSLHMTC